LPPRRAGKGLSVAYPAFSPRAHCRRRRIIGAGIEAARGGAWLLPPGDGQVIADTFFSDSTLAFDAQGHLIPVPSYRKFELGTYIEYGLTNWLTLVRVAFLRPHREPSSGAVLQWTIFLE
jgi:hypothetical protein